GCAQVEHVLAPRCVLADEVAARIQSAELPVEHGLDRVERLIVVATREGLPAHPDSVDLIDEDDARAAPLTRGLVRVPREEAHDQRVDADERLREARPRNRYERRVEPRRDRLRQHRLPGARRTEEQQSALTLAACELECLT